MCIFSINRQFFATIPLRQQCKHSLLTQSSLTHFLCKVVCAAPIFAKTEELSEGATKLVKFRLKFAGKKVYCLMLIV